MSNLKLFLLFFLFITLKASLPVSFLNTTHKCSAPQNNAMLLFKQSLFSINDTSYDSLCQNWIGSGYHPIMMNWNTSTDCCEWDGVSCNPFTGDVIGVDLSCGMLKGTIYLNSTLFLLPHIQRLNLAYNNFTGSQLPRDIGKFSNSLTHLNLSDSGFTGEIPLEIYFLSKLVSLDLSYTSFNFLNQPHFLNTLFQNCTLLKDVWLTYCGLDGYLPIHLNISSLISLNLGMNFLKGRLPDNIFNLQHLELLDLSDSYEVTGPFPKVNRSISLPLKWLVLQLVNVSGEIPDSIGYFKSLNNLDLSLCSLVGSIPKSIVNLKHLTSLYLVGNDMLNGTLPSFLFTLPSIEYINLSYNMFSGVLPSKLFICRSLKGLSLSGNQFEGLLDLHRILSTLTKLEELDLSFSGLYVVTTNTTDYVSPDFDWLGLASCKLTMFPEFIRSMKKLWRLDLSDNDIRGHIPDWAGELNELNYVNLSHNSITGLPLLQWDRVTELYLQSNQIQGPFPPSICNMINLEFLDMSSNSFGGVIPKCLRNNTNSLEMINLKNNHFNGTIPNVFNDCGRLGVLILNENQLEGELPSSLSKCQYLRIIDLGNNQLHGTFPGWLGDLPYLQVLVLKSNNFHCTIGTNASTELPFRSLQVLDLSHNGFVGHLPERYFQNFIAMKNGERNDTILEYLTFSPVHSSGQGYYSIIIAVKGHDQEFQKLLLNYTIIDLSSNRFEGEIPNVIGSLNSLIVLNVSHNNLNGQIPHALGTLTSIESLDLSWNQLTGEIPQSIAGITTLEVLNLSHNHLVGRIPEGTQFKTFEGSSFGGNLDLCGFPLPKCEHRSSPQVEGDKDEDEEDADNEFTWKVVMMGYGCGTLLGLFVGYLMLSTGKPKWFNEVCDATEHMILKRQNKRRYIFIAK